MHIFQWKPQFSFRFGAARSAATALSSSTRFGSAPHSSHSAHGTKQRFEKVAEWTAAATSLSGAAQQIVHVDGSLVSAGSGSPIRRWSEVRSGLPIRSELIVFEALVGIAQDFVGFLDFFELFLGLLVVGIEIRMILAGQL